MFQHLISTFVQWLSSVAGIVPYQPGEASAPRAFQSGQGLKDYRPERYRKAVGGCQSHASAEIPTMHRVCERAGVLNFIGSLAYSDLSRWNAGLTSRLSASTYPPHALQAHINSPLTIVVPCTLSESLSFTWSVSHIPPPISFRATTTLSRLFPSIATGPDDRSCVFILSHRDADLSPL